MKKMLLLFLLLTSAVSFTATAQPYQSIFGKDSTMWSVFVSCNYGQGWTGSVPFHYYTNTEVQNGGHTYKQVILPAWQPDTFLIREDTLAGKVWLKHPDNPYQDTVEHLMIDFTLQLGDTFRLQQFSPLMTVDSVYYINGLRHIRFDWLPFPNRKIEFIEGVGCTAGLSYSVLHSCRDGGILCIKKDTTVVWTNPFWNSCDLSQTNIPQIHKWSSSIYPNPVCNILNTNIGTVKNKFFKIYNMYGSLKMEGEIINSAIDVRALQNGVYFLQITTGNRQTQYFKFLKQ